MILFHCPLLTVKTIYMGIIITRLYGNSQGELEIQSKAVLKKITLKAGNFRLGNIGIRFGDIGTIGVVRRSRKKRQRFIIFTHAAPRHVRVGPIYIRRPSGQHLPDNPDHSRDSRQFPIQKFILLTASSPHPQQVVLLTLPSILSFSCTLPSSREKTAISSSVMP